MLHLRLQFITQAQAVMHQHVRQVVKAPFEVLAPGAGALQTVCGAHIKHEHAVDHAYKVFLVEVRCK